MSPTEPHVTGVRIVRRETRMDGRNPLRPKAWPYSEVFITTVGAPPGAEYGEVKNYYTRLFHPIDDSPHAREAQKQDFLRRMRAASNAR